MEQCPDDRSYFFQDISNGLSVVSSLLPKKYFMTNNLIHACDSSCTIQTIVNSKGKAIVYCCNNDISYNGKYCAGYLGKDISENTPELSYAVKKLHTVKENSECYNGANSFYYLEKNVLIPYHTQAIKELHQIVITQSSLISGLQTQILDLSMQVASLSSNS